MFSIQWMSVIFYIVSSRNSYIATSPTSQKINLMQAPVIRGGFQFVNESRSPDSILGERMYVDSDRLRQAAAYINEHHVLSLVFTPALYKLDNLDFLRDLPGVQGLYIQKSFPDLSPVYALKGLRVLRLQDVSSDFDLGAFPELEVVSYHYSRYV